MRNRGKREAWGDTRLMLSPSHSALARLQQVITVSLLSAGVAWLAWYWRDAPLMALAGFAAIVLGYSLFLAAEFVALRFVGRSDTVPQPTWRELARAWLGETVMAPRVFCWRQPFRWRLVPDELEIAAQQGRRGAVFIHGFVCNRGFWNPWLERLRASGHPFIAVNLEPVFGSIEDYAPIIEDAVRRVTAGHRPAACADLPQHGRRGCASLASRKVGRRARPPRHYHRLAASRHLARSVQPSGERAPDELAQPVAAGTGTAQWPMPRHRFTCWYSNCDNIVFPASTATLEGADNRLIRGVAHVDLAFHPVVMDESLAMVTASR